MVVAEHAPRSCEGVVAELAGVAVGANIDENADVGVSALQGVLVVWSELFAPLPVEVPGEAPGRADITAAVQMPGGVADQLPLGRVSRCGCSYGRRGPDP